ncbi:MAG: HAMP domain-containing histidine kinase [Chitinophagales bacterium]|nr:HAMP domain-containing histidine kinase [Chitinophagales bacterium]
MALNIYNRKQQWKWYLAAGGVLIVTLSLMYTRFLADKLIEREKQQAEIWAEAQRSINQAAVDTAIFLHCDLNLPLKILASNTTIPVILVNQAGQIEDALNVKGTDGTMVDTVTVRQELIKMYENGIDSVDASMPPDFYKTVYYSHSNLLRYLNWYPYVQLFLIALFIAFGYLGFSSARRAEENQVWLGMAKETAHQLGTPISAILGWLETLKLTNEDRPDNLEMLHELGKDVDRLELVADRFSKIGATPDLHAVNFYQQLEECRDYMQRRAPRKVRLHFPNPEEHAPLMVNINPHLFDWVIENLLRNAIDAMEGGQGEIRAEVYTEGIYACVDVSDTGKGIAAKHLKTVFKPGYSTKTRGWGLGLSLSKRIVEKYHKGKIFVKRSELGKGTTFTVKVPMR